MKKRLFDLNMLQSMEALSSESKPYLLFGLPGHESESDIVHLLLQESLGYHEVERDVRQRELRELEEKAAALSEEVEYDYDPRTGEEFRYYPNNYEFVVDKIASIRKELEAHEAAIERLSRDDAQQHVREVIAGFEIRPRAQLEACRAAAGEGLIIELFDGSYGLEPDPETRLLLRRAYLDLPDDRDWF